MALIVFQHDAYNPPSRLGSTLRDYGHHLRVLKLYEGETVPPDLDDVDAVVSMGGRVNVDQAQEHPWLAEEMDFIRRAHEAEKPIVGICLGAQLIAKALGGEVGPMDEPEVGWHRVKLAFPGTIDPLHAGIPWQMVQFHMHGQEIKSLPDGATPLAGSQACKTQAFKVGLTTYGFQYHFERTREEILASARQNPLLERASTTGEQVAAETDEYYPLFHHLSGRLAHNIANLLMSIDKRVGGREVVTDPNSTGNWQPAKS